MSAPVAPVTPEEAARNFALLEREVELADRQAHRRDRTATGRFAGSGGSLPPGPALPARLPAAGRRAGGEGLSGGTGLTPAARAALMADAKARALGFAAAVRSGNAQAVQRLSAGMSPEAWRALAIVLAEAADAQRLLAVVQTPDDGLPAHLSPRGPERSGAARPVQGHPKAPVRPAAASTTPPGTVPAETKEASNAA